MRLLSTAVAAAAGAAASFFMDPQSGRRRRIESRDRSAAALRRTARMAQRGGRRAGAELDGQRRRLAHAMLGAGPRPPASDEMLADRVRSELFRDAQVPKGMLNINVERGGVVVLRGEVQRQEIVSDVESRVRRIAGVRDVENLVHTPGSPAPMHS